MELASPMPKFSVNCKKATLKMVGIIKNAVKIDYDIKSESLNKEESHRLSQVIADYKKRKATKQKKPSQSKKASC
ncbi:MAG TPA: hypothetical protein VG052_09140 [Puia sp.]|jgi:hypothetical protein|nr:hypothetical protein [Puia sp.]